MRKWSSVLAASLVVLAGVLSGGRSLAADWVQASSYADAEGKWTYETRAYDLNTGTYSPDGSNRAGWGAVLKLNYATPVDSDRVRVSTDFGYGVVDKVKLTVTYSDDSTASMEYGSPVVQDVTYSTLTFTRGLVKSVEFSYHYLSSGWIFWLYECQLYQCPAAPDPLSGTTLEPSSINATSAVLHGKVVSNGGLPCWGRFVYWKSPETKLYTPWRSDLGNNQEFTAAVSALDENAGYAYQTQLAVSANPAAEDIVTCEPLNAFTTVKVDETSSIEWVSPSLAWADAGTWEFADQGMDDDTATFARCFHEIDTDTWSPFVHYSTDLQSNGIRVFASATNTDMVDIDILKDGVWQDLYQGIFTGGTWQQFPFEKGLVTEARIRLHGSIGYASFYWNLMEVDFHQKDELRTTRFFVGPGSDWSSAANWSAESGGTGGASVPGTGCVAIFDANSPNCTLSANISVEVIRLEAGYTGVFDAVTSSITIERNRGFGELKVAGGEIRLGSATHTIKDNLRVAGGTVTPGTSTVGFLAPGDGSFEVAGSVGLNNVRFYHSNSGSNNKVVTINGTVTANGSLTMEGYASGGWHLYLNSGEIVAKGAINGNGKVIRGTANLTVAGDAADQVQTNLQWGTSGTYTVNKPAGKLILAANEKFGETADTKVVINSEVDAVSMQPTVWLCGYAYGDVKITGNLTAWNVNFYRNGGTGTSNFDLSSGTLTVLNTLNLNMTADGGWRVNLVSGGTVDCKGNVTMTSVTGAYWSGATLRVSGTGDQSIALGTLPLGTTVVDKASGTASFPDGLKSTTITLQPGSTVAFGAGKTVGTSNISWRGEEGLKITLRSTVDGQRWLFKLPERYVMDECYLEWVDVKDSDASLGQPAVVAVAGTDSGNNINWDFLLPVDVQITTPAESATSPAWVEGTVGPNVTEMDVSVNGGAAFPATRDAVIKWFANNSTNSAMGVGLSPTEATQVVVTGRTCTGREASASQNIVWAATDLRGKDAATNSVTIRQGDSLLLTAVGSENEFTLDIDADGDGSFEKSGVPDEKFVAAYNTAGVFTATAKIDGGVVGSLKIVVVSVDLHGPIACQVNYLRTKDVIVGPAAEVGQISFVPADPFYLQVSVNQNLETGARLNLKPLGRGKLFLQARIGGANGPVVAHQEIDEFTTEQPARVGAVFNGRTGVGQSRVTMRPFIPGMRFKFVMFSSGASFNGGLTQFYAYTSDAFEQVFDPATNETIGVCDFGIEVPAGCNSYCFTVYPEQTGSGWLTIGPTGSSNGDVQRLGIGGALLFVREDNNEDVGSEQAVEGWESHGNTPANSVTARKLSFIEEGTSGYWQFTVDTNKLHGQPTDRSYSDLTASSQYVARGNFRSYPSPYAAGQDGESFAWPLDNAWESFSNEVSDRAKVSYKPGIQYGAQGMVVVANAFGLSTVFEFGDLITIARLEVDGAVPEDSDQSVSNDNVTTSTRDAFPKVVGELPKRAVEYVDIPDPEHEGQTIPNAKPIASFRATSAVWSGSGSLSATFDASASFDADTNDTLTYQWDYLGNDHWTSPSTSASGQYTYPTGVYTPKLKVKDGRGTESEVCVFERIIVHDKAVDREPEAPAVVAEPLGVPVQVTLLTAPHAVVDVKLKVKIDQSETQGMAAVSLSGARKECNSPEYFSLSADSNGRASRVVYIQGLHYNSVLNAAQLVVEGKEQLESAKSSPDKHFEWVTAQQDGEGQPFTCTDSECFNVVRYELVEVQPDESTTELNGVPLTIPSASITLTRAALQVYPSSGDGAITGSLDLSGVVTSNVCNTTAGVDGTIGSVTLIGENGFSESIALGQVSKTESDSRYSPFPYCGAFSTTIPIDMLSCGTNHFAIVAANPTQGCGFVEFAFDVVRSEDPESGQVSYVASAGTQLAASSNEYHPLMLRLRGCDALLADPSFRFLTAAGGRKVVKLTDGNYYLANAMGTKADVALLLPGSPLPVDLADLKDVKDYWANFGWYLSGFCHGLLGGGWSLVADTVTLAYGIVKVSCDEQAANFWIAYDLIFDRDLARQEVEMKLKREKARMDAIVNFAKFVYELNNSLQEHKDELIIALISRDPEKLAGISEEYLRVLTLCCGVFEDLEDDFLGKSPREQGYLVGRVAFEVIALLAPFAKGGQAAKAGQLATNFARAKILEDLLAVLKAKKIISATTAAKIEARIFALRHLKMCFAAGTLVHTQRGLCPIETVRAGDYVLSADTPTMQQQYRLVLETVTTRARKICHISYHVQQDSGLSRGSVDEEHQLSASAVVACTPEHPFWVVSQQAFVEAKGLVRGDHLQLVTGAEAVVISARVSDAPSGTVTYNLNVDGFHTYYVGNDGVLVHNLGNLCENGWELLDAIMKKAGGKIDDFLTVLSKQKHSEEELLGAFDDAVSYAKIKNGEAAYEGATSSDPGVFAQKLKMAYGEGRTDYQAEVRACSAHRKNARDVKWVREGGTKQPDFLVNGVKEEVYSPEGKNWANIGDVCADKAISKDARILNLDLDRASISVDEVPADFLDSFVNSRIQDPAKKVLKVRLLKGETFVKELP